MNDVKQAMFVTSEQAPEGHLKWLMGETDELIPREEGLYYELAYDEDGSVYPTVVVRDEQNEIIAGVPLTHDEMMSFARWAFQNGLAILNMKTAQFRDLTQADVLIRSYLGAHVADLFAFVKEQLPAQYDQVVEASAAAVIERAVERTEREADVRLRSELTKEREAVERRYAQHIVQLSKAATLSSCERDAALDDPILQDVILKSVNILADRKRTA